MWLGEPHLFAAYDQPKIFSYLIKKGADINARNVMGENVLMFGIRHHSSAIIDLCIQHKIDLTAKRIPPDSTSDRDFNATEKEPMYVFETEYNTSDDNKDWGPEGTNALYYAMKFGDMSDIKKLISAGTKAGESIQVGTANNWNDFRDNYIYTNKKLSDEDLKQLELIVSKDLSS
jgi:ankyrin repeat protein